MKEREENLSKRAFLNALTGAIDFSAKILVGFFLNPIMIGKLGTVFYGAWQVIGQLNSYMATADIRAATSLKYLLARNRSVSSDYELKQAVSKALYANAIFIPLYSLLGIVIIWFSPMVAGVEKDIYSTVRIATSLVVISFITTQFFFLFESTLHGMNLAYKRIGIRAVITVLGGIMMAIVLYKDQGIVGLAAVQIAISVTTGFTFWWIVKRTIPWFAFVKVDLKEVIHFIKLSGWFMLLKFADLTNQSIDMILLGLLAGPKQVSVYAITKYTTTAASGLAKTISNGVSVGIGKFVGESNAEKIASARQQLLSIQWYILIVLGAIICLFNQSFITLWTEKELYGGPLETFLIVGVAFLIILYQIDSSIINFTLDIKRKIVISCISSAITILLACALVPQFKITGLLVALIIGNLLNVVLFANRVASTFGISHILKQLIFSRTALIGFLLLGMSAYMSNYIVVVSWLSLVVHMFIFGLLLIVMMWFIIMRRDDKILIINKFNSIKKRS